MRFALLPTVAASRRQQGGIHFMSAVDFACMTFRRKNDFIKKAHAVKARMPSFTSH
jgi:hypothetical protein